MIPLIYLMNLSKSQLMRYNFTLVRMSTIKNNQEITNGGEDMEKRETLYTVGGNVNWYSHCGKQYGGYSRN